MALEQLSYMTLIMIQNKYRFFFTERPRRGTGVQGGE